MDSFALGLLLAFALLARRQSARSEAWFWQIGGRRAATAAFAAFLFFALWVTTSRLDFFVPVLGLLLLLPGELRPRPTLDSPGFLQSRAAPILAGLLSACVVGVVWGSLHPVARVHDEAAYLLQAQLFASGHWTGPGRPLPEFFEQMQVFVTPSLASKYPPGHSLVLVPGIWLGMPALMPLILNFVAGALVFAHARRIAGAWVGVVTWLLWVSAPGTFQYQASYLSQNTTIVLWLLGLWSLREWISSGSKKWLILLASCLGLGAITRPMTMFALTIPIGVVLLRHVIRLRLWKELMLAIAVGSLFLALGVMWSVRTIGQWKTTPYREYSRVYFPYEWTGFGERPDRALRPLPPGMASFDRRFRRLHAEHRVATLPDALIARLGSIFDDQWGGGRRILGVFALLGTVALPAEGVFALVSAVSLVLAHLDMAHFSSWTVYYVEIQPVLSLVAAVGICGVLASALLRLEPSARKRLAGAAGFALVLLLGADLAWRTAEARESRRTDAATLTTFREGVDRLPDPKVIVFVRYSASHDPHRNFVVNEADLQEARAWIVHDLGARDDRLIAIAPERTVYLYDEANRTFSKLYMGGSRRSGEAK